MTDPKKVDGAGALPVTAGAIGQSSPNFFPKTLALTPQSLPVAPQVPPDRDADAAQEMPAEPVAEQVVEPAAERVVEPAAAKMAEPAAERTIDLSDSDMDLSVDRNPPLAHSGHSLDARTDTAKETTDSGGFRRRPLPGRRIAFAAAGAVGVLALGLAVRAFVQRTSASAPAAPPVASASAVPPSMSPPPAASAPVAVAATADPVTAPPNTTPPAASAPAKHPAPKTRKRPVHPKSGPAKNPR